MSTLRVLMICLLACTLIVSEEASHPQDETAFNGKVSKDDVIPEGAEHSLFEEERWPQSVPASQLETSANGRSAEQTRVREYTDHQREFARQLTQKLESEFSRQKDDKLDKAQALLSAKRVGLAIHHQILAWEDEGGEQLAETKSKQMEEEVKDLTEEQQQQHASKLVDKMVEHPYYKHLGGPYLLEVHDKTSTKLIGITLMSCLMIAKACAYAAAKVALKVALKCLPKVMKMSMRYGARFARRYGSKFARWFAKRVPKNLARYTRKFLKTAKRWNRKCNKSKFCKSIKRKVKKEVKKEIKERIRNSLEDMLDRVAGETCGIPQPCADAWASRKGFGHHISAFDTTADSLTDCANKANYQVYHGSGTHSWHRYIDGVDFHKSGTCRMFAWMSPDQTIDGPAQPSWASCSLQPSCRTVVKAHFDTKRYEWKTHFHVPGGSKTYLMQKCAAYIAHVNDGANAANCRMHGNWCECYAFYGTKPSPGAIKQCKVPYSTYNKCANGDRRRTKDPNKISGLAALSTTGDHQYNNYYSCTLWPAEEDPNKKKQRKQRDKRRSRQHRRRRARGRRLLGVPTPLPALADTPAAPVGRQLLGSNGSRRRGPRGVHPDQGLCYWESINAVIDPCRKDTIQEGQPTSGTYHLMPDKSISLEDCATQVAAMSDENGYNAVSVQKYLHSRPDDPELDCYGWKGSNGGVAHNYRGSYRLETCMLQNGYEVDSRKIDSNYKIAPEYLTCNDVTSGDYLPVSTEAECRKACATFKNSIFYRGWWNNIPAGCSVIVESDTPERLSNCHWNTNMGSQPEENSCASQAPYTEWNDQSANSAHGNACFRPGGKPGGGDWECPDKCKKQHSAPWCVEKANNSKPCRTPKGSDYWPKTRNVCRKNDDCIDPVDGHPVRGGSYHYVGSASSLDDCASKVVARDTSYVAAQIQRTDGTENTYDCYGWRNVNPSDFRNGNYHESPMRSGRTKYEVASCMLNANGQLPLNP